MIYVFKGFQRKENGKMYPLMLAFLKPLDIEPGNSAGLHVSFLIAPSGSQFSGALHFDVGEKECIQSMNSLLERYQVNREIFDSNKDKIKLTSKEFVLYE